MIFLHSLWARHKALAFIHTGLIYYQNSLQFDKISHLELVTFFFFFWYCDIIPKHHLTGKDISWPSAGTIVNLHQRTSYLDIYSCSVRTSFLSCVFDMIELLLTDRCVRLGSALCDLVCLHSCSPSTLSGQLCVLPPTETQLY